MRLGREEKWDAVFSLCCGGLIVLGLFWPGCALSAFAAQLLYALVFTAAGRPDRVFCQLFFLLPYASVFKIAPGSASLLTYLEILIPVMLVFRYRKLPQRFLCAWLAFAAFVLFSGGGNASETVKRIVVPLLILCFFRYGRCDFGRTVLALTLGLLTSGLAGLWYAGMPELEVHMARSVAYETGAVRFCGLYNDPNYYSIILILAISCLLSLCAAGRLGLCAPMMCIGLALFGLMTVSKSFLLMFAVVFPAGGCLLLYRRRRREGALILGAVILAALTAAGGRMAMLDGILARLRSGSGSWNALTTGRTDLWMRYLAHFAAHPSELLTGCGVFCTPLDGIYPHNTALDFLYFYGLGGTALFVCAAGFAFGGWSIGRRMENFVPAVCMAVMMMFISSLPSFDFAFVLMLSMGALRDGGDSNSLSTQRNIQIGQNRFRSY